MQTLIDLGLPALFLLSFLAATVLPLGSEWLLVALLLGGTAPVPAVVTATAGNSLGALTTWALGLWGGPWLWRRVLRLDATEQERALRLYQRYGAWSLLLSWLPVIGDPLCLVAGLCRLRLPLFLPLVVAGKAGRYAALAALTLHALR